MVAYFSKESVEKLNGQLLEVRSQVHDLSLRMLNHDFLHHRSREHARHGFCRRIRMMSYAIETVFTKLPPEQEDVPQKEVVDDVTMAIHSFVLNTYGCLDNVAWIWVWENRIANPDGTELNPKKIGLGKGYKEVRKSLPGEIQLYLESIEKWFTHIKDMRDALAHRIPLYIPPGMVDPAHVDSYKRLDTAWYEALRRGDHDECDRVREQQRPLTFFKPLMTHSYEEKAPIVVFHSQLLIDLMTVSEIANRLLDHCK